MYVHIVLLWIKYETKKSTTVSIKFTYRLVRFCIGNFVITPLPQHIERNKFTSIREFHSPQYWGGECVRFFLQILTKHSLEPEEKKPVVQLIQHLLLSVDLFHSSQKPSDLIASSFLLCGEKIEDWAKINVNGPSLLSVRVGRFKLIALLCLLVLWFYSFLLVLYYGRWWNVRWMDGRNMCFYFLVFCFMSP